MSFLLHLVHSASIALTQGKCCLRISGHAIRFWQLLRCADRVVNIMKVYIAAAPAGLCARKEKYLAFLSGV